MVSTSLSTRASSDRASIRVGTDLCSVYDVAESVAFLVSERSRATTGCVITVDGGVPGAFPR